MTRNHGKAARDAALRDRDAGKSGNCDSASDAGNYFEAYSHLGQKDCFLSPSAENEGITALEPNHVPSEHCVHGQKLVDVFLTESMVVRLLPDVDLLGMSGSFRQQRRMNQPVIHEHVGRPDALQASPCDQPRGTRSCAYDKHLPTHPAASPESCRLASRLGSSPRRSWGMTSVSSSRYHASRRRAKSGYCILSRSRIVPI